jgi:predicted dehydrogenase
VACSGSWASTSAGSRRSPWPASYAGAWWPDGHTIGYEHTFTQEVRDLLQAIADGRDPEPTFADGLQVQEVLDAVQRSAASGAGWTELGA